MNASLRTLMLLVCTLAAAELQAQNACRNACAQRYPASNQAAALNSCNASCNSTAATPTQNASGWNMSAGQRQLAAQNAQVQQSQQQLNAARSQEVQAQMDQLQAQQQASAAGGDAVTAGFSSGMVEGTFSAGKANYDKRIDMVRNAIGNAKSKSYTNRAASVALADPFAEPATDKPAANDAAFTAALAATCLEMGDKDHPGARVVACQASPCKRMPAVGQYPFLPDGRTIDSPETLAQFKAACSDPTQAMAALTEDGAIVEVK
jgi:hypothetical protein